MPRRFFGRSGGEGESEVEEGEMEKEEAEELEEQSEAASEGAGENDALLQALSDYKDKYLRTLAELENIKKRNAKERSELLRYAGEHLARDLLTVVDDLERALGQPEGVAAEEVLKGVQMIFTQFTQVLERHGVKAQDAVGEAFDPKLHDALAMVPSETHPGGTVMEQLKKAYFFKDKLLRPAQVVVSSAVEAPAEASETAESQQEEDED